MRNIFILLFAFSCFALDSLDTPEIFSTNQILTSDQLNDNESATRTWTEANNDSIETKFIRFTDFADSTISKAKFDSLVNGVYIDTINNDTLFSQHSKTNRARIDTAIIDSAKIAKVEIDSGFFDGTYTLGTAGIGARPKNNKGLIVVDSSLSSEISIITTNSALHSSLYLESDNGEFSSYLRTYGSTASNANEMFLSNPFGTINFYPGDGSPTKTMTIAKDTGVFIYNKLTVDSINVTYNATIDSANISKAEIDSIVGCDTAHIGTLQADSINAEKGSFTATLTGVSGTPTGTCYWTKIDNVITIEIPTITGTSNSTAATLTGLPTDLIPANADQKCFFAVQDNSNVVIGMVQILSDGVMYLWNGNSLTFTGSGTKGAFGNYITYRLR